MNKKTVRTSVAAALVGLSTLAEPNCLCAAQDVVCQWNLIAIEACQTDAVLMQNRTLAMAHAAMFDAANGVDHRFEPCIARLSAPAGVSADVAVAAAAHTVLRELYPEKRAGLDAAMAGSLSAAPPSSARDAGIAYGVRIGEAVIRNRKDDGAASEVLYEKESRPGVWRPTPPGNLPALCPGWGSLRPFLIDAPDAFAPPSPPSIGSPDYATAFAEVESVGGTVSATRTTDQTEAAVFWTGYPPLIWSSAARQMIEWHPEMSLVERARVMALLSGVILDATIVGWKAKYDYALWRPITAIHFANEDGNPATEPDSAWEPLVVTPPFPCYVSGHAITSGAAKEVLTRILASDSCHFVVTNPEVGITREYESFSQLAREAVEARIWGGVHFRPSQEEGYKSGERIGESCLHSRLRPIEAAVRDR